ncbi:hypothetical protein GMST_07850 [Geomonas silvestris]|uniref:diguanylate cyclase n=1 Tax=Geomonas silvestris TaxID=2740184 RepID=A0A6V8MEP9_9BACT|nr:GGDEF domain-containing protein [Geomonas silvestris]GFO58460.1 hypothetical protein GMST_07850 [Geomonas silvestris]
MSSLTQLLVFLAGLVIGLALLPALRHALKRARWPQLHEALERLFPVAQLGTVPPFAKKEAVAELLPPPDPASHPVDPREQQINDSAQAVRSILLILTAVIERTEQAASESSLALKKLRESFERAGLPAEVAAATSRLTEQIDRMVSNNASLREKLASSQKILSAQQRQIEMLRTAVLVDGMTRLANRSYFDDKLAEMLRLRQRYDETFFLIILDVDHFKSINDTHGHQAGDLILKGVAQQLRTTLRESDFVARFGGDEFAVILIKSTPQAAEAVARKLCNSVRERRFTFENVGITVTLSVGAAEATEFDTAESLVERADAALYRVKEGGRNGVFFAENPVSGLLS